MIILIPKYKFQLTCTTKRVVYDIKCDECHETYVGQTIKTVRERINKHIALIKRNKTNHMSLHFNRAHDLASLQSTQLEKVSDSLTTSEAEKELQIKETLWIRKLSTLQPWAMNYIETRTNT